MKRDMQPKEAYANGENFYQLCRVKSLAELRALPPEKIMDATARLFETVKWPIIPFYPVVDGHVITAGYNASIEKGLLHNVPIMAGSTRNDLYSDAKTQNSPLNKSCIQLSLRLEKLGRKPAYIYYFTQLPQGDDAGAFHSSELWYIFGTLERSWRPKTAGDYLISEALTDYWTNFIKTGDPNGSGLPVWKPCSAADLYVQVLDEKTLKR